MCCILLLRILHRNTDPDFVVEALDQSQSVLTRPTEAHGIRRVDGHRQRFRAVIQSMRSFGKQTPHLTASKSEAVIESSLSPCLALPQTVAITLVVVGSHTGREKVSFNIAGQFHH